MLILSQLLGRRLSGSGPAMRRVLLCFAAVSAGRALGNGPETAKELAYGRSIRVGAFCCTSRRTGMRCVVVMSGHGFRLSRDGVRRF